MNNFGGSTSSTSIANWFELPSLGDVVISLSRDLEVSVLGNHSQPVPFNLASGLASSIDSILRNQEDVLYNRDGRGEIRELGA